MVCTLQINKDHWKMKFVRRLRFTHRYSQIEKRSFPLISVGALTIKRSPANFSILYYTKLVVH